MTDVVARARVRAAEAKQALDSLTEVAAPMIVQLELAQGRFSLTVHGESGHWWATASVKAADGTEGSAPATSVIVSRMLIREAIDSEALLNPERDCALLILGGEVVRYGTYAVAQAPDAQMPLPPLLDQDAPAESGLAVERGDGDGAVRLRGGPGVFLLPEGLAERLLASEISKVDLHAVGDAYYARVATRSEGGPDLVLTARVTTRSSASDER